MAEQQRFTVSVSEQTFSRIVRLAAVKSLQEKRNVSVCDIVRSVLTDYFVRNPQAITVSIEGEEIQ